jgi:hypothetical protein
MLIESQKAQWMRWRPYLCCCSWSWRSYDKWLLAARRWRYKRWSPTIWSTSTCNMAGATSVGHKLWEGDVGHAPYGRSRPRWLFSLDGLSRIVTGPRALTSCDLPSVLLKREESPIFFWFLALRLISRINTYLDSNHHTDGHLSWDKSPRTDSSLGLPTQRAQHTRTPQPQEHYPHLDHLCVTKPRDYVTTLACDQ